MKNVIKKKVDFITENMDKDQLVELAIKLGKENNESSEINPGLLFFDSLIFDKLDHLIGLENACCIYADNKL